jgi:Na+/proline symporter
VIISAAMSSTAGELNALGSTTTIDFYKRVFNENANETHYVKISKYLTLFWGVVAILFALFAQLLENLIEAVNILGSVFYGTILGVFLVAFIFKHVKGNAVFIATLFAQAIVFILFAQYQDVIAYLWFNLIGCASVIFFSLLFYELSKGRINFTRYD